MAETLIDPPLIQGIVIEVFRALLHLNAEPIAGAPAQEPSGMRVTATVTMSGPPGSVPPAYGFALEMPEALALKLSQPLSSVPLTHWSPIIGDACGEIINMIAGNAKKHLIATYMLTLPTVVRGNDYRLTMPKVQIKQIEVFRCGDHLMKVYLGEERSSAH